MNFTYIKWDLVQCPANFSAITTAVYIKMICILETLHFTKEILKRVYCKC